MFTRDPKNEEKHILSLIKRIIGKLPRPHTFYDTFSEFVEEKLLDGHNSQFREQINQLDTSQFKGDSVEQDFSLSEIETLAKWFQNSLDQNIRKDYAANYTSISAIEVMSSVYSVNEHDQVIDPFCGSGRLLMGLLRSIPKGENFPHITINEYMLFPCLLASYDLISYYLEHQQDVNKISINLGDAFANFDFEQFGKFDLVLMNPPFTRIHRINSDTKSNLATLISTYPDLIIGQPGLHYFALLLANNLLKTDGKIVSILPGSTFVSLYSKPLLRYYLNNYEIKHLVKLDSSLAFSDGSEFKEVVFSANKTQIISDQEIKFSIASSSLSKLTIIDTISIPSKDLHLNWNWLKFFENPQLLKLEKQLLSQNLISSGLELNLKIIRGVEMYGPNFFCIPNTNWKIQNITGNSTLLQSKIDRNEISIPTRYLVKALRKSGYYNSTISPKFEDYLLSVPIEKNTDESISHYSVQNRENSIVAQNKFGEHWIHHINRQINTKQPFGYLFLIDKLSIETSSVVCHFFDNSISATKNFYIIKGNPQDLKLQAAWINSSCFLIVYLANRREIGGRFGRMQIVDFLNTSLFIDFNRVPQSQKDCIIEKFDNMRFQELPSIPNQIGKSYRKELDQSILDALGFDDSNIDKIIEEIYISLKHKIC